jgi:hypothetical protein
LRAVVRMTCACAAPALDAARRRRLQHSTDVLDHRELFARWLRTLHAFVGKKPLHERDQFLPIRPIRKELRQRCERPLRLIANDDLLLAAYAAPLVRGIAGSRSP